MAVVKALNIHRNGEDVTGKLPVIDPGIGLEGVGVDAEHCFKRVRRDFYPGGGLAVRNRVLLKRGRLDNLC